MNMILAGAFALLMNGPALGQTSAKVVAQKGPIELTLRVYDTKVKLHDDSELQFDSARYDADYAAGGWAEKEKHGVYLDTRAYRIKVPIKVADSVWFQIELKNVGTEPFSVADHALFDGNDEQFKEEALRGGLRIAMEDANGKEVAGNFRDKVHEHGCPETPWHSEGRPLAPELQRVFDEARKKGLSEEDAIKKVDAKRDELDRRENTRKPGPPHVLQPGQSVVTRGFVDRGACLADRPNPPTPPPGRYAELYAFEPKPGRYRLYAVYDHAITPGMRRLERKLHLTPLKPGIENLSFKTPAIVIEVLR